LKVWANIENNINAPLMPPLVMPTSRDQNITAMSR
jgi:hypothetical protein